MFSHLALCFPSAKITDELATCWMIELKDYAPKDVYNAIKTINKKTESNFLPNVFQIMSELERKFKPHVDFNVDWLKVESMAQGRSRYKVSELSDEAQYALQCLGGTKDLGMAFVDDMKWIRKDFMRMCEQAKENDLKPRQIGSRGELTQIMEAVRDKLLS